jgi:hypothetical protein
MSRINWGTIVAPVLALVLVAIWQTEASSDAHTSILALEAVDSSFGRPRSKQSSLSASVITGKLFPLLALPRPTLKGFQFSLAELLDEVVTSASGLTAVNVAKNRFRFELDQCASEFTVVSTSAARARRHARRRCTSGNTRQPVAVESADPRAVIAMVDQLGIGNRPLQLCSGDQATT